ncbi:uncharacterized protein LOC131644088 [Vicia villosa]|uniref:uncharacterized protein LOC131644088 n=1 Tax=Vicia villosa TaxID=3911 RepID=UPI00273B2E63|nr:uncharacterized protein LOC131644088 [Vicia villosa]
MALKIDISKAYDRVDWGFLKGMLSKLGFADRWIHWVMMCVISVNYSVLVNSDRVGPILPGRGLRANIEEVSHLMEILTIYANASGQEINLTKSEVFFSRNLSIPAQEDIAKIMGVRHVFGTGTYLGLPSMIGRRKKETFAFIKDRIWKRINSWRGRSLSKAGKEVMIKSVLQSIPSYIMSVFIIPDGVVKDIEKMLNSFWSGGGSNNKGIRWMAWDKLSCPKKDGGMGFRDFRAFNAKLGNNPSFVWRSLWKAKDVLLLGCRWRIGDGRCIKWDAHVVNSLLDHVVAGEILKVPLLEKVDTGGMVWKEERNGEYNDRSGYRLWMTVQIHQVDKRVEGNWNRLWNIMAPPRAKHLLWRICRGCLPTRIRLRQHYVQCLAMCQTCEREDEEG